MKIGGKHTIFPFSVKKVKVRIRLYQLFVHILPPDDLEGAQSPKSEHTSLSISRT